MQKQNSLQPKKVETKKPPVTTKVSLNNNKTIMSKKKTEEMEVKKVTQKTGFTGKPSAKLEVKKTDIFSESKAGQNQQSFQYVYNLGGIPCKIDHGSIKNKLKWNQNIDLDTIGMDPLLITCFEGLIETKHPFSFIAHQASIDLLQSEKSEERVLPLLNRLVWPLRNALRTPDTKAFYLKNLLNPLAAMMRKHSAIKQLVLQALGEVHMYAGEEALKLIRAQVPDYYN